MTTLAQHLSNRSRDLLKANRSALTRDGEIELQALLGATQLRATERSSFAGGAVPLNSPDLAETETNLARILETAHQMSGGQPIDAMTLQQARLSLCPIFPFC
jgi:hypothetical protein